MSQIELEVLSLCLLVFPHRKAPPPLPPRISKPLISVTAQSSTESTQDAYFQSTGQPAPGRSKQHSNSLDGLEVGGGRSSRAEYYQGAGTGRTKHSNSAESLDGPRGSRETSYQGGAMRAKHSSSAENLLEGGGRASREGVGGSLGKSSSLPQNSISFSKGPSGGAEEHKQEPRGRKWRPSIAVQVSGAELRSRQSWGPWWVGPQARWVGPGSRVLRAGVSPRVGQVFWSRAARLWQPAWPWFWKLWWQAHHTKPVRLSVCLCQVDSSETLSDSDTESKVLREVHSIGVQVEEDKRFVLPSSSPQYMAYSGAPYTNLPKGTSLLKLFDSRCVCVSIICIELYKCIYSSANISQLGAKGIKFWLSHPAPPLSQSHHQLSWFLWQREVGCLGWGLDEYQVCCDCGWKRYN